MVSQDRLKEFYDKFGAKQDLQAFYEDRAIEKLLDHCDFARAKAVFEFGAGTGRFAERLLSDYLRDSSSYFGIDVSSTMVHLSTQRVSKWKDRAAIRQTDTPTTIPANDASFDRVVANYVMDLLPDADIVDFLDEAYRVLLPGGLLCLVSLTYGETWLPRAVSAVWAALHRIKPLLVGGCRPITLTQYTGGGKWKQHYHETVAAFGIASEILVAGKI